MFARGTRTAPTGVDRPVALRHDALFVDLDGVVYKGDDRLAHASEVLEEARRLGLSLLFLTNNSSKTPQQVVDKLSPMGVHAIPDEILTSGQATAAMLLRDGWAGRTAFVIGEQGVRDALADAGIRLLDGQPERADLVVVGWDRQADYTKLRIASVLVERGASLVATNADASYPAPDGLWPGAGALLAAVTTTTGAVAEVVGKPHRPLFEAAERKTGATHPLVVGDRLDTDITGARRMGWDSLLVLTGAAGPRDLLLAGELPTYVGKDLRALLRCVPRGEFRRAGDGDVSAIGSLLQASGLSTRGIEQRVASTWICQSGSPQRIEATACLDQEDGFGILRAVAVRESSRGNGLGLLAVAAAMADARSRGISQVSLFTESAGPFFERLGFRAVERADLPLPVRSSAHASEECAESATPMVLELAPVK
jgi:glycerol 3-phosphatase-2